MNALLDLVQSVRFAMVNTDQELPIGLLGWVSTLARLNGYLTLGTELEHAMVRLAYREGLLPADRMGTGPTPTGYSAHS